MRSRYASIHHCADVARAFGKRETEKHCQGIRGLKAKKEKEVMYTRLLPCL